MRHLKNEVRIISGKWKGRKLHFPGDRSVRPTLDRARTTLFNWLTGYIEGSRCLDLFAGSGALGFEAHSRGALRTTLVDADIPTAQALRRNALRFDAREMKIHCIDALRFLATECGPWDLVFLDPPYDAGLLESVLLALRPMLPSDAIVYCESREAPDLPPGWQIWKQVILAGGCMTLLKPDSNPAR